MPRVLLISHTCQSRTEGQPKAEILAEMPDIDLKVIVPDRWKHYGEWRAADVDQGSTVFDVQKVRLPWAGPAQFYLHYYPALGNVLRSFKPDVVDLWEEPWGLVSAQACRLRNKFLPNAKIISETEQNLNRRLPPPFEIFRSYTLRNADYVVGRSREAVEVAESKGYRGPSSTVPNAVDTKLFRPLDRGVCRQQLGWPQTRFIAGYVGRLVERKGLADFVDAVRRCPAEVTIAYIGTGPMHDWIKQQSESAELLGRVLLVPGKPLSELPAVMNALDVLVLPSRTVPTWKEQFGRVIIEAHACGVPVIGSDSGAIAEVIEDGGIVFPEGDAAALANALNAMFEHTSRRHEMGKAGSRQVNEKYTWRKVAERMAKIYRQLADG